MTVKSYQVTMRNPINGYTWNYYTSDYGMGCKAIAVKAIEE